MTGEVTKNAFIMAFIKALGYDAVSRPAETHEGKVETTPEEMEGFLIVKIILRQKVKPSRISIRDAQSYFAILLDDKTRKAICRRYLNGTKKYLAVLDENKKVVKKEINTLDDIFESAEGLLKDVLGYDGEKKH